MIEKNWKNLVTLQNIKYTVSETKANTAKIDIMPLEKGFGLTMGNALRRTLLSSIQGAAITSIKMDGVLHEFSDISFLVEDIPDLIMNLKAVSFVLEESVVNASINVKGPAVVTAKDIVGDRLKVINPDLVICNITDNSEFKADLTICFDKGYKSANDMLQAQSEKSIGSIFLDANFSPIKNVNFYISDARIGQKTDYDKLTMEITTDGSILPEDALSIGARILTDQLSYIINFEDPEEVAVVETESKEDINMNLIKNIEDLDLTVRSANCLRKDGINYVGDLVQCTESELLSTANLGRKSLNEIKDKLYAMNLELGTSIDNWQEYKEKLILKRS